MADDRSQASMSASMLEGSTKSSLGEVQAGLEDWPKRLIAEGFIGQEDGSLDRLAAEVANFQASLRRLRQVALDEGHLHNMSEGEFAQVILKYTWPVAILQPVAPNHRNASKPRFDAGRHSQSSCNGGLPFQSEGSHSSTASGAPRLPPLKKESHAQVADTDAQVLVPTAPPVPNSNQTSPARKKHPHRSLPADLKAVNDSSVVVSKEHYYKQQAEEEKRRRSERADRASHSSASTAEDLSGGPFGVLLRTKTGQELIDEAEKMIKEQHVDLASAIDVSSGALPIHFAVAYLKSPGLLKLLIDCGADVLKPFEGRESWHGLAPGENILEFIVSHRKACIAKGSKSDRWTEMEEMVKREIDRIRGWQTGRRNKRTRSTSAGARQDVNSTDSESDGEVNIDGKISKRAAPGHGQTEEVMRSLYAAKAGCLCEHYECHPNEFFDMIAKIGEGAFGAVWRSMHKQTRIFRAIKQMQKLHIDDLSLWSEISIMRQLDHPHIMKLFSTFEDKHSVFIVSELCSGGQLFDAIIDEGSLSERKAANMMKQILQAVTYCHKRFICHRDLKPENFMLLQKARLEDIHIKLIDFGTAKRFDMEEMTTKVCTVHYVAPELLKSQATPYTEKCDVWSAGVILYVMLCGAPPFNGDTDMDVLKKVKKGTFSFRPQELWDHISHDAVGLINRMICFKVADRISAEDAYIDKWIDKLAPNSGEDELDNDKILNKLRTFSCYNRLKKVALQVIAQNMNDETIHKLGKEFVSIDAYCAGALTVKQMEEAFQRVDCDEAMKLDFVYMMHEMAADTGEINYTQFLAANLERSSYLKEEACKAAFTLFDVDGDGQISLADLEVVFASDMADVAPEDMHVHDPELGDSACALIGVERAEIERIMRESDKDGDGSISFDEFVAMMANRNLVHHHEVVGTAAEAAEAGKVSGLATKRRQSFYGSPDKGNSRSTIPIVPSELRPNSASNTALQQELRNVKEELRAAEEKSARTVKLSPDRSAAQALLEAEEAEREAAKPKVKAQIKKAQTQVLQKFSSKEHDKEHHKEKEDSSAPITPKGNQRQSPRHPETKARRQSNVKKTATLIFGKEKKAKSGNDLPACDGGGPYSSESGITNGLEFASEASRHETACISPRSGTPINADGPNPLWEVLSVTMIDMTKLREMLAVDTRYINTALDKKQGVPPALFFAVALRLPEMVKLLVDCRADVRQRYKGSDGWREIKPGQTAMDVNESQKYRYIGTQLYDRCEAIAQLIAAEEDRIRQWYGGRRISEAADKFFSRGTMDLSKLDLEDIEMEAQRTEMPLNANLQSMTDREATMAKTMLYAAEATCMIKHISTDPTEVFDVLEKVGEGTFGAVYRMKCKFSGQHRAMKTVPKELLDDADLWHEIGLMRCMDHPLVAKLFGTYEAKGDLHMILENCAGGELYDIIDCHGSLPQKVAAPVFQQMLMATSYIHSKQVCHRDLKPENFLLVWDTPLASDSLVKMIDFGTARHYSLDDPMTTKICTIHYVAPEILVRGEAAYTEKCDLWSLGVCLYLMLSGTPPFNEESDAMMIKMVRKGKYQYEPQSNWHGAEEAKHLISLLLLVDHVDRLSARQALQHPWIETRARQWTSSQGISEVIPRLLSFMALPWFKRKALEFVASRLAENQVNDLRPLWFSLDLRSSGKISHTDLAQAIPVDGLSSELLTSRSLLLDRMKSGDRWEQVGYTSFLAAMLDAERRCDEAACKSTFHELDFDGDNLIRIMEISILWKSDQQASRGQLSPKIESGTDEACREVLTLYDRDGDSALNFAEFMSVVAEEHK
jgi:calcium-dependent protein kinase